VTHEQVLAEPPGRRAGRDVEAIHVRIEVPARQSSISSRAPA